MYLLLIRYILMLSCSVVSCGKEKKTLKNSSYLIELEKNSASCPLCNFIYFEFYLLFVKILYIFKRFRILCVS